MIRKKPKKPFGDEWFTPPEIVKALGEFDLDPCCGPLCRNRLANRSYGPREDGLKKPWRGRVWCNPPFSNVRPFVDKMVRHGRGTLLIFAGSKGKWQMDLLRAAGYAFIFSGTPLFGRPKKDLPGGIRERIWLVPFGKEDIDALRNSGLPGLFFKLESV